MLRGLPFKLTGGLHHAVRGDQAAQPMHGLLNVLLATHEALDGAETRELARELARHDTEVLVTARLQPAAPTTRRASARASRHTAAAVCSTP